MRRFTAMMRPLVFGLILGVAACQQPTPDGGQAASVQVADLLCRPTAQGRQVTACYMTLTSSGPDTLTAVTSPRSALGQIHETNMENNMMVMYELDAGLPLAAGEPARLEPGATHVMLLGVREPLAVGDVVPLTLTFAAAPAMEVEAPVAQPALPGT